MNIKIPYGENTIEINEDSRFFVKTHRNRMLFAHYSVIENDDEWTECTIRENGYSNDNTPYKVDLIPCDDTFSSVTFYWESFIKLLNSGEIIYKANEYMDVVPYRVETRIPNSCATIVEEGTMVVDVREYA